MATIFLRIDHTGDESLTERFLLDCTPRQEALLRRANRKTTSKDRAALLVILLCTLLPNEETLAARKAEVQNALSDLMDILGSQEDAQPTPPILTGASALANTFFASPYGIFKVNKSPISLLDSTADYRVSTVVVMNDLDRSLLGSLKG